MRYKFNPFERAVGFFLVFTILGSAGAGVGLAIKKNWFERKNIYFTYVDSASNIRAGSSVLMSGLKVGRIETIELDHTNKIRVNFSVLSKYGPNITEGTEVLFVRPFIIGDKVLTLTKGDIEGKFIASGSQLRLRESYDLIEVLSGKKAEAMVGKIESILDNLNETMILGKDIAFQVGDKKKLQKTLEDVAYASAEVRKVLPKFVQKAPIMANDMQKIVANLETITTGLKEVGPEGSKKTIELLDESIVVLQAMQKSFFLRSHVKDIKEDKAKAERLPASE